MEMENEIRALYALPLSLWPSGPWQLRQFLPALQGSFDVWSRLRVSSEWILFASPNALFVPRQFLPARLRS